MNTINKFYKISLQSQIKYFKYPFQYKFYQNIQQPLAYFPKYHFNSQQFDFNKIESILKQPNNYDSIYIMNEYKNYVNGTTNYQQIMEISNQFLKQMKNRKEDEKALEICQIVVELCNTKYKINNENPHMFFKGQLAILCFKLGKVDECNTIALSLYKDFTSFMNRLNTQYLIMSAKYLLEVMAQTNCLDIAKKLLNDISDLLALDNWQSLSPQQIYEFYYLQFGILYLDSNYLEAAEWGWKSYEQLLKLPNSMFRPEYILQGMYICYRELKNSDKCNETILEILKFQQIDKKDLDSLEKSYLQPFTLDTKEEKIKKFKSKQDQSNREDNTTKDQNNDKTTSTKEQQEQSKEKQQKTNDQQWSFDDDKGNYFIKNKAFKEGITYYKEILSNIDSKKEPLKYIFVQDRIAYLHSECENYPKAIELCLNSHSMLLQIYHNKLAKNQETFQNISYLKSIYEKSNDLSKSIEWGEQWHSYCYKYNLFETESEVLESNMLSHIRVLSKAGRIIEALEYCQFIVNYLQKFNKGKEMLKFGLNQLLFTLSQQAHNTTGQKEAAISLCEISRGIMNKEEEYKQHYFRMLKESVNLSLELGDMNNFMKYGQEYLKVRNQFQDEHDDIENTIQIMFNIGQQQVQNNNFNEAVEVLKKAIDLSKRAPIDANQIQINLLLTTLYILQNNLEEAEKYLAEALYLYDNHFTSQANQEMIELDIIKIGCIFNYHKGFYNKTLNLIERYFDKLYSSENQEVYEDIIIILSNLQSSSPDYEKETQRIISKYNINVNP